MLSWLGTDPSAALQGRLVCPFDRFSDSVILGGVVVRELDVNAVEGRILYWTKI